MQKLTTLFLLLCAWAHSLSAQSGLKMFDESYVHEIRIYFEQAGFWDTLSQHFYLSVDTSLENVPLPARVMIDGNELDSVGVSQKGYYSNWGAGNSLKKPLKLDFNEFVSGAAYDDLKSLSLQNAFMDPSMMRDMLSYRILRDFGVAAPRSAYAKVFINDQYWGLYVLVESVNKTFLKEHFGNNDGNLYKANYTSLQYLGDEQSNYAHDFELKTNVPANDWSRLIAFIKAINVTPDHVFRDTLLQYFEPETYFKTLAVDVTINNWDSHFEHGRNFYLYDNPQDGKFHWIPWDYNLAFASSFGSYDIALVGLRSDPFYDKILPKRVLGDAEMQEDYLQVACDLHHGVFTEEHLNPIIEYTKTLIKDDLEDDPNKFYPDIEDFELSLTVGFERTILDTFSFMDSIWNGTTWEFIDTVFIWEYTESITGLQSLIAERNASIQTELSADYGISCMSAIHEPKYIEDKLRFEAWPNPASSFVNLKVPTHGTLSLYDANGRIHKRTTLEKSQIKIPLQGLRPGIYWIEFATEAESSVKKIVVQE